MIWKTIGAMAGFLLAGGVGDALDPHSTVSSVSIVAAMLGATGIGAVLGAIADKVG